MKKDGNLQLLSYRNKVLWSLYDHAWMRKSKYKATCNGHTFEQQPVPKAKAGSRLVLKKNYCNDIDVESGVKNEFILAIFNEDELLYELPTWLGNPPINKVFSSSDNKQYDNSKKNFWPDLSTTTPTADYV